ncbi:MAG: 1-deoxy-D-xylulose-5-phosphate reductoisomerase [Deltaproteobacteria bacterium]|nr:1-deoxy-D-xylulose-5-phosphate reductoisomerase [Deltaproteobacteria bacterium]
MDHKKLTILGSTGSIGRNTLDVVSRNPDRFSVHALAAHSNHELLARQVEEFRPALAVLFDEEAAGRLKELRPNGGRTAVAWGMEGLLEAAGAAEVDQVVAGMVGAAGLLPTHAAVSAGKQVGVANKEVMVLAGELMMNLARQTGAVLLPVDSEHNAIFQCLNGEDGAQAERIILTASGGPFLDLPREKFISITREQALRHPNWNMGPKITIDSATMMNKGLEVIEARWFFGLPPEQISVLVHPQSIVHSMVEFVDGSVLAQLGLPDMRVPISYCLSYPERLPLDLPRLNLGAVRNLEFREVDHERFVCLSLALRALKLEGGVPAALNGANEEVVAAYLAGGFPFHRIGSILEEVMEHLEQELNPAGPTPAVKERPDEALTPGYLKHIATVDDAVAADGHGRKLALRIISQAANT